MTSVLSESFNSLYGTTPTASRIRERAKHYALQGRRSEGGGRRKCDFGFVGKLQFPVRDDAHGVPLTGACEALCFARAEGGGWRSEIGGRRVEVGGRRAEEM